MSLCLPRVSFWRTKISQYWEENCPSICAVSAFATSVFGAFAVDVLRKDAQSEDFSSVYQKSAFSIVCKLTAGCLLTSLHAGFLWIRRNRKDAEEMRRILEITAPVSSVDNACLSKILSLAYHDTKNHIDGSRRALLRCIRYNKELFFRFGNLEARTMTVVSVSKVLDRINWKDLPKIFTLPSDLTDSSIVDWEHRSLIAQICDPYAVSKYSMLGYQEVNTFLRKKDCSPGDAERLLFNAVSITQILQKEKTVSNTILYRSTNLSSSDFLRLHKVNETFQDLAFLSTSITLEPGFGVGLGVVVHYTITSSQSGVNIVYQSAHKQEQEVLFRPKTRFKITSIEKKRFFTSVEMEEDAYQPLSSPTSPGTLRHISFHPKEMV